MLSLADMQNILTRFRDHKMQTHSYRAFEETETNHCTQFVDAEQAYLFILAL